jgi:hypothetical protein
MKVFKSSRALFCISTFAGQHTQLLIDVSIKPFYPEMAYSMISTGKYLPFMLLPRDKCIGLCCHCAPDCTQAPIEGLFAEEG